MAAKDFTKNPRHFPRCTKLSSFTAATLGASGPKVALSRRLLIHVFSQLQPEGWTARGGTRLRGSEGVGPLRGLGIRPLVSAIRGLGTPLPRGPYRAPERLSEAGEALQGPYRGVFVFNTVGKEGGPLRGPPKISRSPGCP